jgi:hypothetical protein
MEQQDCDPPPVRSKKETAVKNSKFRWATLLAAAGVITLAIGGPAAVQAQTTGLVVEIPFEFQVANQKLPPGTYKVWLRGNSVLSISDGNGQTSLSLTNATHRPNARNAAESTLVFTVYGNRHFLNEVRWAGYPDARTLLKSKTEIELARNMPSATAATIAKK